MRSAAAQSLRARPLRRARTAAAAARRCRRARRACPEAQGGTLLLQEVERLSPERAGAPFCGVIQESEIDARGHASAWPGVRCPGRRDDAARILSSGCARAASGRISTTACTSCRSALAPLRARREELPDLARQLLRADRRRGGQAHRRNLPARRRRCSSAYDWPGNLRQLENAIFRAVALADGGRV